MRILIEEKGCGEAFIKTPEVFTHQKSPRLSANPAYLSVPPTHTNSLAIDTLLLFHLE